MKVTQTDRIAASAADARQDDVATRPARARPAGVAEVSVIAPIEHPPVSRATARHDASFVTQLIATAQHSPQTRVLRRAEPAVARAAYLSTNEQNQGNAQAAPRLLRVI
jgi:hypothetical protein